MLIVALVIIAKKVKHSKCPSTDEYIYTKCNIPTTEYHQTIRGKEELIGAIVKLSNSLLSKQSQAQ